MPKKRYTPEEIVAKLRQVDVLVSQGQNIADAIRQIGVSEVTYYRCAAARGHRACPAIRPLRLSQDCGVAGAGRLARQRQAGRADLATRGAESPP
jgi:hypothetical protein